MMKKLLTIISVFTGLIFLNTTSSIAQCITSFPYIENFDSGAGGWVASSTGIFGWTLGTPAKPIINSAASSPNSWITGNLTSDYVGNANAYVQSPCFDFSNLTNPGISLSIWWECEFSWDGAVLMASTDGTTYSPVGGLFDPVNWYNDNTINSSPCGQLLGWTGRVSNNTGSGMWLTAQHKLSNLAGQPNVRFRICFTSDIFSATGQGDGFAFDDVIISELPSVDLGPDTVICIGNSLVLDACVPSATDYQWTSSVADTFCTKTVTTAGFYIVIVEDTLGFETRDTIQVSVSPTNVQLPSAQLICPGDTLTLNASNPWASHLWLPTNETTMSIDVFQTGVYTAVVSDTFGCVSIDSVAVTVDFLPNINLGNDTTICIGESLTLDAGQGASPGSTFSWNFGGASTPAIVVTAPGTYIVTLTTLAGCQTGDSLDLSVALAPVVNLGPDRIECDSFQLNANNPGSTYLWSNSAVTQNINTNVPGQYWVEVTNPFGCSDRDTVVITPGVIPTVNLGPDLVICNNQTVTLDAGNAGSQFLWSTSATTQTITVGSPGQYQVIVTNADQCTDTDTVEVILSPLTVNLGPDFTICDGDSTLLNAGNTGDTYMWSTGATTPTIYITAQGAYQVTVMDTAGCVAQDAIFITAQANFNAALDINPDTSVLYQMMQFTDLSSGNPTSWLWDFGDGTSSTLQNPTHAYQSIDTFTICLTVSDGVCTNTVCEDLFVDIFAGLEEELGLNLEVYPNPNHGTFTLDFTLDSHADIQVSVFDLAGRVVFERGLGTVATYQESITLSGVTNGLYLLRMSVDGQDVYRKIIVR